MEDSKNEKIDTLILFRLIRELWYDSNYCEKTIKNSGYRIYELSKGGVDKTVIIRHFDFLLKTGIIKEVSHNPPVYEFTEAGKKIKTESDIERIIKTDILDNGPFYHGTKADLKAGDLLIAGFNSNYKPEVVMNHIYFTALVNGAGLAAELAKGDGTPRVYIVEPTGEFENDPNVTDKKFPGNPTRSYRSSEPLKVVGEVTDWIRLTPEELKGWHERLANIKGDIIN